MNEPTPQPLIAQDFPKASFYQKKSRKKNQKGKKPVRPDTLTIALLIIFLVILIIGSDLAALLGSSRRTHRAPFGTDPRPPIEILIPER